MSLVAPAPGGVLAAADQWRVIGAGRVRARGAWPGDVASRVARSPDGTRIAAAGPDGARAALVAWDTLVPAPR